MISFIAFLPTFDIAMSALRCVWMKLLVKEKLVLHYRIYDFESACPNIEQSIIRNITESFNVFRG